MYKHITPRYHRQQLMTSIISGLADEPSSTNLTKVITTTSSTLVILIIIVSTSSSLISSRNKARVEIRPLTITDKPLVIVNDPLQFISLGNSLLNLLLSDSMIQ